MPTLDPDVLMDSLSSDWNISLYVNIKNEPRCTSCNVAKRMTSITAKSIWESTRKIDDDEVANLVNTSLSIQAIILASNCSICQDDLYWCRACSSKQIIERGGCQ